MGNRISKVYTRTGDNGTTGIGDGSRIEKDNPRIIAIGALDELNSHLGLLLCEPLPEQIRQILLSIQHELFDAGGELSLPGSNIITARHVEKLEHWLDTLNEFLQPLREFILPGGTRAAAISHIARSHCRRCETLLVTAARTESINRETLKFINRLSDLLFVIARYLNHDSKQADIFWRKDQITHTTQN